MAARSGKKTLSFEQGLDQLEKIAHEMETTQLPLEELLKRYEEGMKLAGELTGQLANMKAALETIKLAKPVAEENPAQESQMSLTDWMEDTEE